MRRLLFFIVIVFLLVVALDRWTARQKAPHNTGQQEKFTPAEGSRLDLKDVQVLDAEDQEFIKLVGAVVPSVVTVLTSRTVERPDVVDPIEQFFGIHRYPKKQQSLGSGVIVSKEGHILTNYHVVANMEEIKVQVHDQRIFDAKVIGADEQSDIAVLKIDGTGLTPLPLGDSDQVKVGQMVFAVGNPFGLQETVTNGIISARNRHAMGDNDNEYFQTNAAINPGNSGGPLVNLKGEMIALNSSIYTGSGGWQGIGFAITSNQARRVLDTLLKNGRITHGYLGIQIQNLTIDQAEELGVSDTTGALVTAIVIGSPAEKARLQPGDIIKSFNGQEINGAGQLPRLVASVDVGAKVQLGLIRNGKMITTNVTIEEQSWNFQIMRSQGPSVQPHLLPPSVAPAPSASGTESILSGLAVSEIPASSRTNLPENVHGVMVTQVDPDSPAADWLQPGDVIEEINRQPIQSVEDFQRLARSAGRDQKQLLSICHGRERSFILLKPREE